MKNIIGIAGSLRRGSYTQIILRSILEKISKNGLTAEELSLESLNLPFFLSREDNQSDKSVHLFKEKISLSSGIILATPEYHGSMSGSLKNALDFLDEDSLSGKLVGIAAVLGGNYGGTSIEHLKTVVHKLKGYVVPHDLIIPRSSLIFGPEGDVTPEVEKRLNAFADHFSKALIKFRDKE